MSGNTRIAVVGACPYPVPQGSQVYLTQTARCYQGYGFETHLCVYGYGDGPDPEGLTIHRAPGVVGAGRTKAGPSWAKPLQDWRMVGALKRVVAEHAIDVIDAHNYEALVVALASGCRPIIYHAHNAMADELRFYRGFGVIGKALGGRLDRTFPAMADHVIAPHERLRDYLVERGCDADRITVIPPSIDPKPFANDRTYDENPVVLYSGNLDAYQNPGMLRKVMGEIKNARPKTRCVVATNDAAALSYAEVVPIADGDASRAVLNRDAVFICPRTSWSGYPIKLLNAMAAGLPVVACAGSAYPVQDGKTGLVVADDDVTAMTQAVLGLLDDAEARRTMGAAGRRRCVDLYAQRGMIREIIEQVQA